MSETFTYENLIGGSQKPVVQIPGTIAIGVDIARGTLLGKKTATNKWEPVDFQGIANYEDVGIAVEDVDATSGALPTTIYVEGEFNSNGVIFSYGDVASDWEETLLTHGIYLRASVNTSGV